MPRHSPCALYSLTYSRYFGSRSVLNYAGNHRFFLRKIVIVTLFFNRSVPQLKIHNFLPDLIWKTSLLPCFSSHLIHCSVFKVQYPVPFETRCKRSIPWTLSSILKSLQASIVFGGDSRDRTGDLLLARQALSQLSYIPVPSSLEEKWWARVGSNHRPYDYQSYALASWATGPYNTPGYLYPLN